MNKYKQLRETGISGKYADEILYKYREHIEELWEVLEPKLPNMYSYDLSKALKEQDARIVALKEQEKREKKREKEIEEWCMFIKVVIGATLILMLVKVLK